MPRVNETNPYVKFKIEDRVYSLIPMPPIDAVPFAQRVSKLLAGAVGGALGLYSLEKTMSENNISAIVALASQLLQTLDVEEYNSCVKYALSHGLHVGNQDLSDYINFDKHFNNCPGDAIIVCFWMVWSHVKDFLLEIGPAFQAFQDQYLPQASKSLKDGKPSTS